MTTSGEHHDAYDAVEAVRSRLAATGLEVSPAEAAAVSGFLDALAPGLTALGEVGRQLSADRDEHGRTSSFDVAWP